MKKSVYRKAAVIMSAVFSLGTAVPAYSADGNLSEPECAAVDSDILYFGTDDARLGGEARYSLIYKFGIGLTIEGNTAYVYAECKTYDDADISITAELQMLDNSWKTIKTFKASENSTNFCSIDKSYTVLSGYDYRVKVTVSASDGAQTETDSKYGAVKTCYAIAETE